MHFYNWCVIITESSERRQKVGVDDVEGPPVPMPNTEVKLDSAEDTWMVTSRENRKMPTSDKTAAKLGFAAVFCVRNYCWSCRVYPVIQLQRVRLPLRCTFSSVFSGVPCARHLAPLKKLLARSRRRRGRADGAGLM